MEMKYAPFVLPTAISTAATVYDMTTYINTSPNALNGRIGDLIETTHLILGGTLVGGQSNTVADDAYNVVRIIFVKMVPGTSFAAMNIGSVVTPRSIAGLISVLFDKTYTLVSPGADSTGYVPAVCSVSISIPLSGTVFFAGTGAGTDSVTTIGTVFISDSAFVVHPGFEDGSVGLYYIDK